jgi:hypothetical protein
LGRILMQEIKETGEPEMHTSAGTYKRRSNNSAPNREKSSCPEILGGTVVVGWLARFHDILAGS